jgi:membrane peptidoglycan carboxypeptidase
MWGAVLSAILIAAIGYELHTSYLQSVFLSKYAEKLSYAIEPGPSEDIVFPKDGPFNKRRGYDRIPDFQRRLEAKNYYVTEQGRFSPELMEIAKRGVTPPYREEPAAGLIIYDAEGMPVYDATAKRQVFDQYEDIPPLIVKSLLFIEDRKLENPPVPYNNPVVNWNRFAMAGILYGASKLRLPVQVEGGSTLATQLEKYRYSPGGITSSVFDKFKQMTAAMLRVYKDGPDTREVRHKIILDYINTAPLAAAPGHGEIYGIGEGMLSWFGRNLSEVSQILSRPGTDPEKVLTFKQAMSLLCAVRAPTYYLMYDYPALEKRVNNYINLLELERIIDPEFAARLRETPVSLSPGKFLSVSVPPHMRKGVNGIRTKLTRTLGISGYYDLARLDLKVETTLNSDLQEAVGAIFEKLGDSEFLEQNGMKGHYLLATGDPSKVTYSFLLFESTPYGNALRAHADNLDQPFDINEGVKLILGSTAKLRTLANYLEVVERLYQEFSPMDSNALKDAYTTARDPITRWVAAVMRQNKDLPAEDLLDMALDRAYSANPSETFFTGGGIHTFQNFRSRDNHRIISVREATVHSINLVYIRLMRDLVRFQKARLPYDADAVLDDSDNPDRGRLLEEIADNEARQYLARFYRRFRGLKPDDVLNRFLKNRSDSARDLSIVFFAWHPGAGQEELSEWLKAHKADIPPSKVSYLAGAYDKPHLDLSDYGFLLKKHPLEVWCAGEMIRSPGISWKKILEKSTEARRISSAWLLKPSMRGPQDVRLRTRIEKDAFKEITVSWCRLGFPFKNLVPSYSTAIGSSCDQPAALAKLLGIIVNDGVSLPPISIRKFRVAEGTPYHTKLELLPDPGERVMAASVAKTLRKVLQSVVEEGTARRAKGIFETPEEEPVPVGGKTGTGDNRYKKFSKGGELISSVAVNRTATFAFFIGDRHFGVVTAFVSGSGADEYSFTSSLPVTILKLLAPAITPHLRSKDERKCLFGGC